MEELYLELTDNEWPLTYTDHDRPIVRAILFDDKGLFHFVRAVRGDDFGESTIIETSGGGVEPSKHFFRCQFRNQFSYRFSTHNQTS